MLECRGLSVSYGQHRALDDVAIRIAPGEIVVILGANGAGKSTLLMAIAGLVPSAEGGQILLDGKSIRQLAPHLIVEAGLALVPEGRRIFGDLTVLENLVLGAYADRARSSEKDTLARVFALFPRLAERRRQVARTMSGGEQQMVAIGRAMMSAPSILMLDEPSLGLSPILCSELFKALAEVRKTGAGILLVEQNARQGLAIADRGYLLENGRIVGEGPATALARDPAVQNAYLGGPARDVGAGRERSVTPPP
ncbi:MAG: ABC transporter ATP-binding protein [Burkholderiales bacterium]